MIRALIIDDEQSAVNVVKLLLQRHVPEVTQIHTAIGAVEGIKAIRHHNPTLVFLDIEMPLMNGFELIKEFPNHSFEIIFITAYDSYAIKAIRFSAIDYLLKPIDADELKGAVQRYMQKKKLVGNHKEKYDNLLHNLGSETLGDYRLAIPTNEGTFFYYTDDIIRCEADGNYTRFYFMNNKPVLTSKTLKEYDELLAEYDFVRVHRAHLINRKHVKSVSNDHEIKMIDNSAVEVSRRKWDSVKQQLLI